MLSRLVGLDNNTKICAVVYVRTREMSVVRSKNMGILNGG